MFLETKKQWREARVIQGGNNLWTATVQQCGRIFLKNGQESKNPKTILFEARDPQAHTLEDAKKWCEEVWSHCPELKSE